MLKYRIPQIVTLTQNQNRTETSQNIRKKHSGNYLNAFFWVCYISFFEPLVGFRTNDPEITNHVLWPTELKRRGWVSYLYRAATTNYLCCDQALEDSKELAV